MLLRPALPPVVPSLPVSPVVPAVLLTTLPPAPPAAAERAATPVAASPQTPALRAHPLATLANTLRKPLSWRWQARRTKAWESSALTLITTIAIFTMLGTGVWIFRAPISARIAQQNQAVATCGERQVARHGTRLRGAPYLTSPVVATLRRGTLLTLRCGRGRRWRALASGVKRLRRWLGRRAAADTVRAKEHSPPGCLLSVASLRSMRWHTITAAMSVSRCWASGLALEDNLTHDILAQSGRSYGTAEFRWSQVAA